MNHKFITLKIINFAILQQAWGIANFNYCFVWIRFFWTSYSLYKTATTLHDNFISILTFWFLNSICHSIWKHYLDLFFVLLLPQKFPFFWQTKMTYIQVSCPTQHRKLFTRGSAQLQMGTCWLLCYETILYTYLSWGTLWTKERSREWDTLSKFIYLKLAIKTFVKKLSFCK